MTLTSVEKEKFLKALEEDREFRYAVMGLLGFAELLERFARLEEGQQRLEERFAELEERFAELEERFARLEEEFLELRKAQQRLEERQQRLEEEIRELGKSVKRLGGAIGSIGRRLGRDFEKLVREVYRDLLEEHGIEPWRVERLRYVDTEGRIIARGAVLEVDVYVHDSDVWLIEVKSLVEPDDVVWFYEKARLAEKVLSRKASRRILLAIHAARAAVETAKMLGIELMAGYVIDEEDE